MPLYRRSSAKVKSADEEQLTLLPHHGCFADGGQTSAENQLMAFVKPRALLVVVALLAAATPAASESCDLFGKIKSKNSNRPVTVTFENRTDALRNVTWLDFNGAPVDYAQLQPGEKFTINTFITHPWMFTDGPGNCHEIFMPKKNINKFRVTVERQDLEDE